MLDTKTIKAFALELATQFAVANNNIALKKENQKSTYIPTKIKPKETEVLFNSVFDLIDEKFGGKLKCKVQEWPIFNVAVPKIKSNYFFRKEILTDLYRFLQVPTKFGLYFAGVKGAGKTSIIEQTCARIGMPVYSETGSSSTEYIDLFGYIMPTIKGGVKFFPGNLYKALVEGGVFLLNEIDMINPSELVKLNELFEGKPLFVPHTEEWIIPHKNFRFIATGNTNGSGNDSNYVGARSLNESFMDRFYIIIVEYMEREQEIKYLKSVISSFEIQYNLSNQQEFKESKALLYDSIMPAMIDVAQRIRIDSEKNLSSTISLRGLERWVTGMLFKKTLLGAFDYAYGNSLDSDGKTSLHEIIHVIMSKVE